MSIANLLLVPTAEKGRYYFEQVFLTQVKSCNWNLIPFKETLLSKVNKCKHYCWLVF